LIVDSLKEKDISMKYIESTDHLTDLLETLSLHDLEIREYFLTDLRSRITSLPSAAERVRTLFLLSNEQKTANLFLKWIWMFNDNLKLNMPEVTAWGPYLHVLLDRWVLRLLGRNLLAVTTDSFETDFWRSRKDKDTSKTVEGYEIPVFGQDKYHQLQKELRDVAAKNGQPAIIFDILWYVGSKYCTYRPLLCDICWLRNTCLHASKADWSRGAVETKTTIKKKTKNAAGNAKNRFVNSAVI
jgi:hypothetical protein